MQKHDNATLRLSSGVQPLYLQPAEKHDSSLWKNLVAKEKKK